MSPRSAPGAIECEAEAPAGHAGDADVVFAGRVLETFDDRSHPAPWLPAVALQHWPAGLPLPTVEGAGVPAARFRAQVAYKGQVAQEVVVHLLGTGPRFVRGQDWTVFASRDASLGLFTTECSGDLRGPLPNPAVYGLAGQPVDTQDWRQAVAGPLLAAALVALLALLALGAQAARRRRRPQPDL